ncbi:MAG: YbhB/YbcL family Raf kinase inhibitor-like protein [Silvibacterium sp.]|nr:YbhB/YbcL family Raf kinase inhibitor-like protein [Silvibacterium sp.]MBV8436576.1 YbhB/YbcL family Raf kinase inhibitor-like protein [Silvibacterium sp.]
MALKQFTAALALLGLGAICACRRQAAGDPAEGQTPTSVSVSSSSFGNGDRIPQKYTCDGAGLSPDIHLPAPPSATKSLLLVMDDPDASGFVHWLVYNIPPSTRDIPEGASSRAALPAGAAEGENSLGNTGYFGPCPPAPDPHHYVFRLYALDTDFHLGAEKTKTELTAAAKGHILAEGRMTALYARRGD